MLYMYMYNYVITDCPHGYYDKHCNVLCPPGSYGFQCAGQCSPMCSDEECDHVSGCPNILEITMNKTESCML